MIEEVKKIIQECDPDYDSDEEDLNDFAGKICQLLEPKPDVCPELMRILVDGGVVRKDATPTPSELLLAVKDVIESKSQGTGLKPDEVLRGWIDGVIDKVISDTTNGTLHFTDYYRMTILLKVASHYQSLEEHCSELVDDVIRLEAELGEAKKQERWNIGEELCCLIGNKMLEDMGAGKLLGEQLMDYMNNCLKVGGSRQALEEEE